ncbi:ATP-grasp domain-containing protein [Sphaerisporangium sp. NPDC005289]|uniref:ATP-grasp domain-containing protein n=1 Tax=Sphaerisporangium sp. NPDC005289 TaxID=3155247 RepID=UPI0033A9DDB3
MPDDPPADTRLADNPMSDACSVLYIDYRPRSVAALAAHGAAVTCVVNAKDAATVRKHPAVDRVVVVRDTTDCEDVLCALRRDGVSLTDYTAICGNDEYTLYSASVVAMVAGKSTPSPNHVVSMRDKFVQKDLVRRAGIPVTQCRAVDHLDDLSAAPPRFPAVIKPPAVSGAKDTFLLRSPADLEQVAKQCAESGVLGPWVVEDFVPGGEIQVDGAIRNGELVLLSISRYLQNCIKIHEGDLAAAVVLDPDVEPALYAQARDLAARALPALGHRDGVFHLEAFEHPDGHLVFSECGGRVGGGMTDEVVLRKFGVSIHDEWARIVLGLPTGVTTPVVPDPASFGDVHLKAPPGLLLSVPSTEELRAQSGVVFGEVEVQVGEQLGNMNDDSFFRAARAVVTGEDELETRALLRDLGNWFSSAVRVDTSANG